MNALRERALHAIDAAAMRERLGRVHAFNGLVIEAHGPDARIGEMCEISLKVGAPVPAEVVGYRDGRVLLMPYGDLRGLSLGSQVRATGRTLGIPVGEAMCGRVLDAFGQPLDGRGAWKVEAEFPLVRPPINPVAREPIDEVLETGIRAIDALLTLGVGQRVGIFAGSGVGKSTLLGMLARHVEVDVVVVAMIGERGREVNDFLRESLGDDGLSRAVVMVATADQPALVRTHAVRAAHAVAEFFRERGRSVLLILDSMTRFAMAQREVGLAVGEPPTYRGYTPSVFAQLPQLLERCGRIAGKGSITAIYSVLVEGDDMNEPVTDHMRSILDGHIVLSRSLAARAHHPAIDVLQSASRLMGAVADAPERAMADATRSMLATWEASRDLVEMGAYQAGTHPALDSALAVLPAVQQVLRQTPGERDARADTLRALAAAMQPEGVR